LFSRFGPLDAKPFANRIAGGEKLLRHRLGDHRHLRRRLGVLWSNYSTLHEWNSHRGEEVRTDDVVSEPAGPSFGDIVLARVAQPGPEPLVEYGESKRRRLYAGNLFDFGFNFTQQGGQLRIVSLHTGGGRVDDE